MPNVRILPDALVDQIAAGEVVERPASAVKELVENAFDAGARRVAVDVESGGVVRIEVLDDGSGMEPEDALLALSRHATSKLRSSEDLARIGTLGFRGEALPSIASVSRLVLTTSANASGLGTKVVADRGARPVAEPARHPRGTRVVVEDLFGNVPARRKFLKSAEAELRAIVRAVTTLALSRPEAGVLLRTAGRILLDLAPAGSAAERFRELIGGAGRKVPLPVAHAHAGMTLTGVVTPPDVTFASRSSQWLFVNGRHVKDRNADHGARLAAQEALRAPDRHAGFVLFLECPTESVDVNVHPQKLEVRFRDPAAVHALVHRGLLAALLGGKRAEPLAPASLSAATYRLPERGAPDGAAGRIAEALGLFGAPGVESEAPAPAPSRGAYGANAEARETPLGGLRLVGQYRASFLLAEGPDGLVLVDQHVAHERVRYERIRSRLVESAPPSQRLLVPVTYEASPVEAASLAACGDLLDAAGFVLSERAGRVFVVTSAPPDLAGEAVVPFLRDFLARAGERGDEAATLERRQDALAASLACRGAITVNTPLGAPEAARLLADLARCRDPWTCPHGRPIFLTLEHEELLRRFGRSVPAAVSRRA